MMWADLVLTNGNVLTMNPSKPHAQAVAIKDDKIVKVGANEEIKPYIGKNTKTINLKKKTVVPGFIDTHVHITGYGKSLKQINLRGANSIKEMQKKLKNEYRRHRRDNGS